MLPVTITFTLFVAGSGFILYLSLIYIIDRLTQWALQFPSFAVDMQKYIGQLIDGFNQLIASMPQQELLIVELENQSQKLLDQAASLAQELIVFLTTSVQSIPNMLFVTLVYLITFFLFSLDLPRIINTFFSFFQRGDSRKIELCLPTSREGILGILESPISIKYYDLRPYLC